MRIGIDFDNTLACYDAIFVDLARRFGLIGASETASKRGIRERASQRPDGERIWQTIQGQVYGPRMIDAVLFDGAHEFLARCAAVPEIEIFIVSHKTEFGHFDESRTNLRTAARLWMQDKGFFDPGRYAIPEANVFFEPTQQHKVARIGSLACDVFIDDLAEVFSHPDFPQATRKLWFANAEEYRRSSVVDEVLPHWADIHASIFGA